MTSCDDVRLAELLCARLCHDLAGPVGAASAGAELFEDADADLPDGETLALVAASAAGAAARLKFFRAAFGPPASAPQSAPAIRELVESYLRTAVSGASNGIGLDWRLDGAPLDGDLARLLINLALVAKDALPRGGRVTVAGSASGLAVTARGEPTELAEEARAVLIDGALPSGPRGAQAQFTRIIAAARGTPVAVASTPAELSLTAGYTPAPSEGGGSPSDG
ncbi:MAG: histidine phosphotransferase family protein [Solirubrobacterales bacterium]